MKFEWDADKAADHLKKHGVGFPEAATVFGDPLEMTIPDSDHSGGEAKAFPDSSSVNRALRLLLEIAKKQLTSKRPA